MSMRDGFGSVPSESADEPESTSPMNDGESDPSTGSSLGDGDSKRVVEFNDNANFPSGKHVFDIASDKMFYWGWTEGVIAQSIYLMLVPDDGPFQIMKNQSFESSNERRQQSDGDAYFFSSPESESTGLNLELFDSELQQAMNEVFSIMISWQGSEGNEGHSYSPYFSVGEGEEDIDEKEDAFGDVTRSLEDAEDGFEVKTATMSLPTWDGNPVRESSARTGSETGATSVSDDDKSDGGGGGGGGLAPGVIAGIVVGIVVFLCLVGLLVWFLLRRRRNAKPRASGYADPTQNDPSNAYIVDKIDTSGQSPTSPYSDDGQEQHTPLDPYTHHYSPGTARPREQPFQDNSQPASQPYDPRYEDDRRGATSQQRSDSAARNYAHLVEDGMTQDDIRRLEEEERQLDDEIERAGRRR